MTASFNTANQVGTGYGRTAASKRLESIRMSTKGDTHRTVTGGASEEVWEGIFWRGRRLLKRGSGWKG
jgi:hypothetical protein